MPDACQRSNVPKACTDTRLTWLGRTYSYEQVCRAGTSTRTSYSAAVMATVSIVCPARPGMPMYRYRVSVRSIGIKTYQKRTVTYNMVK